MPLASLREPFDHPDWLFEVKYDGFRALAYIEAGICRLVSRKGHVYTSAGVLARNLAESVPQTVVLDGEIVCLDQAGRPQFHDLLWRRGEQHFYAFDLLYLDGRDLTAFPLEDRKAVLRSLIPRQPSRLPYADFIAERGMDLFRAACQEDLEGIVAKHRQGRYTPEATTWVKIKDPHYSQGDSRRELFEARRSRAAKSAA